MRLASIQCGVVCVCVIPSAHFAARAAYFTCGNCCHGNCSSSIRIALLRPISSRIASRHLNTSKQIRDTNARPGMETHGFERVTLRATNGRAPAALHHAAALEGGRCVDPIRMPYIGQFDDGAISSDPPTDRKG